MTYPFVLIVSFVVPLPRLGELGQSRLEFKRR